MVSETKDLNLSLSKVLRGFKKFSEIVKLLKILPCSVSKNGSSNSFRFFYFDVSLESDKIGFFSGVDNLVIRS